MTTKNYSKIHELIDEKNELWNMYTKLMTQQDKYINLAANKKHEMASIKQKIDSIELTLNSMK